MAAFGLLAMAENFDATVDEAYNAAMTAYRNTDAGFPSGFSWVKGADGRTRSVRALKNDSRFSVRSSATGGTIISINGVGDQFLDRKVAAYREFLRVMHDAGYLDGATVYSRWD